MRGSKLGNSYEKNTIKQEFNVREKRATYRKTIKDGEKMVAILAIKPAI